MRPSHRKASRAFSLVELVIVVVILAIIGAIAIPRMSRGAKGASDSALISDLAVFRSAIDLYATEHGGDLPGLTVVTQLTQYSDINGGVLALKDATHIYGPYLRQIPPMPVGSKKGARDVFVTTVAADTPPGGAATDGWWYNSATGEIRANLPVGDVDESGKKYNTY